MGEGVEKDDISQQLVVEGGVDDEGEFVADEEAAESEEGDLKLGSGQLGDPLQDGLDVFGYLLHFVADEVVLQFLEYAVVLADHNVEDLGDVLDVDGRVLVGVVLVEVLDLVDGGEQVLEADRLQLLPAGEGVLADVLLLLLIVLCVLPGVVLAPGLGQAALVDLAFLLDEGQHAGDPAHQPEGSALEEALLDVAGGAEIPLSLCGGVAGLKDGGVPGEEAVLVVHEGGEHLGVGELQVVAPAPLHPAEADGVEVLVGGLGHGAVVEGELLPVDDVPEGVHPYEVAAVGDGDDGPAVGVAAVGEPAREVALPAGVHHQHVAPQRLVAVLLHRDVVELRHVVLHLLLLHYLLYEVLPVVPPPRLVYLPEVLDQEGALLDPRRVDADCPLALCVHPEGSLVLRYFVVLQQQVRVLPVPPREKVLLLALHHALALGLLGGVALDEFADFLEAESLGSEEVERFGEGGLDEGVFSELVGDSFLEPFNIYLGEAVVDDVPGVEVDAPGDPLFNLPLGVPFVFAAFPLVLLDLAVSALGLQGGVCVLAFYFVCSVGALGLPPVHEAESAEGFPLGYFTDADAVGATLLGNLLTLDAPLYALVSSGGGRDVLVDFLVLPEVGGDDRPLLALYLIVYLFLHQPAQVLGLVVVELPEEVLFVQGCHCFLKD